MRESGLLFAPLFGWAGVVLFVVSSPWILIGVVGVFLGVLYLLVSHYSFSYQKPLVYSMIGSVLLVIALSSFIQATSFHGRAGDFVARHGVPGLTPMYKGVGERPSRNIASGEVIELTAEGFVMVTSSNEDVVVRVTKQTRIPRDMEIVIGDQVYVFGPQTNEGIIDAFGVRPGSRPADHPDGPTDKRQYFENQNSPVPAAE